MDARIGRPRRESAATYRRRRLMVGVVALALLAFPVLLIAGIGDDAGEPVEAAAPDDPATTTAVPQSPTTTTGTTPVASATTVTTVPPDGGDARSSVPATTAPVAPVAPGHSSPYEFLACVRARESRGDYTAVSNGGTYGAYQIDQVTWDATAEHAGLSYLRGIQPNLAAPASQDAVAMALLQWQGAGPWAGGCTFPAPGT